MIKIKPLFKDVDEDLKKTSIKSITNSLWNFLDTLKLNNIKKVGYLSNYDYIQSYVVEPIIEMIKHENIWKLILGLNTDSVLFELESAKVLKQNIILFIQENNRFINMSLSKFTEYKRKRLQIFISIIMNLFNVYMELLNNKFNTRLEDVYKYKSGKLFISDYKLFMMKLDKVNTEEFVIAVSILYLILNKKDIFLHVFLKEQPDSIKKEETSKKHTLPVIKENQESTTKEEKHTLPQTIKLVNSHCTEELSECKIVYDFIRKTQWIPVRKSHKKFIENLSKDKHTTKESHRKPYKPAFLLYFGSPDEKKKLLLKEHGISEKDFNKV